jgi:glutamate/tyrosine decarboxylase-like PLP-dependent enzyme
LAVTEWEQVGRQIEDFLSDVSDLPVTPVADVAVVREAVASRFDFRHPIPLTWLIDEVGALLRDYTVQVTHPRYFGLFNPSVSPAGIAAEALVALYNPQLATWSHAPAANEIERLTLRHFARALGYDANASCANFTTGGLEANLSAVISALVHRFPDFDRGGIAVLPAAPVIYVTSETHHSFAKICRLVGLGTDALREVPVDENLTMRPQALREQVDADNKVGRHPLLVVGTAGSTGAGIVDPLQALAEVAASSDLWFHVDAAWGGAAVLVPRLRPILQGIELADSITWDAHKWLSAPMGAGMFFSRRVDAVRQAFDVVTSYMPPGASETVSDPYRTTLQWSRRAIGVKVFMRLAELGHDGLAQQIDHQARMGEVLRTKVAAAGWIVANQTALPLACLTHDDIRSGRCRTEDIVKCVQARGRVWISDVVLGGRERVLRACITSFRTQDQDLDVLVDELERARRVAVDSGSQP